MTDLSETLITGSRSYQEGIDAYWEGIAYERNPYLANSIEYQRWTDGWVSAESADSLDF